MTIILPIYRPSCCKLCPLCGKRPPDEMMGEEGTKFTHRCLKDNHLMSGRGLLTPNPRHRCTPRQWNIFTRKYAEGYEIDPRWALRYGIHQQQIIFPPDGQ